MTRKVQFRAWGGGQFKRQRAHRPIHALEQFTSLLWSLVEHSSLAGFSLQVFSLSVRWPLYGGKMSFLPFSFPRSIALGALSASRLLFYCSNCMCSVAQGFFRKVAEGFLQSNLENDPRYSWVACCKKSSCHDTLWRKRFPFQFLPTSP